MKKQFCVGKIEGGLSVFITNRDGSYIFNSEEEALEFLNSLDADKKANAQIYCREVSPWVKVGDFYTEPSKEDSK